jgi:acid phosphatase class B
LILRAANKTGHPIPPTGLYEPQILLSPVCLDPHFSLLTS